MTHSRRKGSKYEREVDQHLDSVLGARWHRKNRDGFDGEDGEIDGRISVEIKNHKAMDLAGWVDQAKADAGNRMAVVVHKRRGKGQVVDHYVTLTVEDFCRLIEEPF